MQVSRIVSLACLALVAIATPAYARSDEQLWTNADVTMKIASNWRVSEGITARWSDSRDGLFEVEATTLLGYKFNKVVTVWAGYTHNPQYSRGQLTTMERRARQQVTFDRFAKLGKGTLDGRIRFEQRWRDHTNGTGWRLRPYLEYSVPIAGKSALNISTEPFINLNETTFQIKSGLDRIRNLVTVSTPLSKSLAGEIGYMNQYVLIHGGADTSDNIAYFALTVDL